MSLQRAPHGLRVVTSICAIAVATGLVYAFEAIAPVLSLASLYLLAVVPIAIAWGFLYAVPVAIVGMLAFNFLFLPPLHTFTLADGENWVALAISLAIALVVSKLAANARRRAAEAEQREREEALLAEVATTFLEGRPVTEELDLLASRVGDLFGAERARIELGAQRAPPAGESPHELRAGQSRVGTLYLREGSESNLAIRRRFLPALASLLAVAVAREELEREALEAEVLRRSDTIKTAVLRAVSHDLQSPLTAVIAAAESLRRSDLRLEEADRDALLDTIATEAARLERLVRDLLDLSRLEAGAAQPVPELWTVDELIGQAIDDLGPEAAVRVEVSLPTELPPVKADASQIRRALANLLENGLKFSPPGEPVAVRATATRREAIIRVVDRGPGIGPAEIERIFQPFYRAGEPRPPGSGLGLSIARGFVEANGGRIWAESRPGQGSSFAMALEVEVVPSPVRS